MILKHKICTHGFVLKEKAKPRPLKADKFKESGLSIQYIDDLKYGLDVQDEKGNTFLSSDLTSKPKKVVVMLFARIRHIQRELLILLRM